jgi:uncharacterized iron-regulated membrane protein
MQSLFVVLHRWLGLALAAFLFLSGLTGAVIAWEHELDVWLNPELFEAKGPGRALPALTLVRRVEQADSRLRVDYTPLAIEPGGTLFVRIRPRVDPATGEPFALGFDQMAIDPSSSAIQGTRLWGRPSLARRDLLPFLYRLHSNLLLPRAMGVELGTWLMGLVAITWTLDSFVALWISFPSRKTWRKSLRFRFREGTHKLTFDLHRSSGVWLWLLLLTLAVTGISLTLRREVMEPIVSVFSVLTPSPLDSRTEHAAREPRISRESAVERAKTFAQERGITAPAGGVFYASAEGLYGVGFFRAGLEHGDGGLGSTWLYVDGDSGAQAGVAAPGTGSAGDVFLEAQFPLHSGRIFGTAGRALVSVLGLVVAMLSATGVIIWARKRRARRRARRPRPDRPPPSP